MINALKLVTIQRGHDPRDLTLIASGGGGSMHAATLGRELGVKRIVIPRHAGLFSAWGMLAARPRRSAPNPPRVADAGDFHRGRRDLRAIARRSDDVVRREPARAAL